MKITLLLLTLGLALGYHTVQYEYGYENSIHWSQSPYHILHTGNSVPRSVEVTVNFSKRFQKTPQVSISNYFLDWQAGSPNGYIISIVETTETHFVIRYTAVADKQLYGVSVCWLATFDPRVHVQWFETTDVGAIGSGEGEREVEFNVPIEYHRFDSPPAAVAYLAGVKFITRNWLITSKVTGTSETSVTIKVKIWYITTIEMVRFCIVMGNKNSIWVSETGGYRIPDWNHNWRVFSSPQDRPIESSVDVPKEWASGEKSWLIGFTGYDSEESRYQRVYIFNTNIGSNKATSTIGVWWDSILYQIDYQLMIYKPDHGIKLFDENCAELFAECDHEGDSITVCDKVNNLPEEGWAKNIRSFMLPAGRTLTLFKEENLRGSKVIFTESQKCLENFSFSLASVHQKEN